MLFVISVWFESSRKRNEPPFFVRRIVSRKGAKEIIYKKLCASARNSKECGGTGHIRRGPRIRKARNARREAFQNWGPWCENL